MSIEYTKQTYGSPTGILAFPDHYVAYGQIFAKDHALSVADPVTGRKIIKAGTIFPANDATAVGVVLNDLDVTDGDVNGAVVVHGFIKTAALPVAPSADVPASQLGVAPYTFTPAVPGAKTVLSRQGIFFMPIA